MTDKIKLLSLFSGVGAFECALDRLGVPYELVGYCEIDRFAAKSYAAVHGVSEDLNFKDVTTLLNPPECDMITYGFPCQDISTAGRQRGFEHDGERTRSGLFFEALRIIETAKPKYAICENVKNLTGKKFKKEFETVLSSLEEAGYRNYWEVLNAKDFNVPQNRERVFIVSIRKDIGDVYFFPEKVELQKRLKDVLEETVDEKFYLSDKAITTKTGGRSTDTYIKQVGNIVETDSFGGNPQRGRVYDAAGISPALNTCQGGGLEPKIIEPFIAAMRGRNPDNPSDRTAGAPTAHAPKVIIDDTMGFQTDVSPCLIATDYKAPECTLTPEMRIRKLTPLECWRLMGFTDEEFKRAADAGTSNSQLYKQAGNSIVVDVLVAIFGKLFKTDAVAETPKSGQLSLF